MIKPDGRQLFSPFLKRKKEREREGGREKRKKKGKERGGEENKTHKPNQVLSDSSCHNNLSQLPVIKLSFDHTYGFFLCIT